jgi:membrane-bound lytic murein transglycosylase MltF
MIELRNIYDAATNKLFLTFSFLVILACLVSSCGGKSGEAERQQPSSLAVSRAASQRPANVTSASTLERWTGDLDAMIERRKIRALVAYSKSAFFYDKGHPRGISYEALRELETVVNKKFRTGSRPVQVTFLPTAIGDLESALSEGRGDLVAWGVVMTPERKQHFEFTQPIATNVKQIIVTGASGPKIGNLDDLSGKEVFANPYTENYQTLKNLSESFTKEGKSPIDLKVSDANLNEEDLLEMANAGLIGITAADNLRAEFWAKVSRSSNFRILSKAGWKNELGYFSGRSVIGRVKRERT